ncbi:MAG: ABC transporter permease [Myxococcaceae bacterium]
MIRNLRELYQYRALVSSLTVRELKARYRASLLGFLWTFLNPTLHMLVYVLMFTVVLKQGMPNYPYFLFVGLLPWICFSTTLVAGTSTISDRRDLLTKVRFPAQVLPATVVAANLANYVLSLPLLVALGGAYGIWPTWHVVLFPVILGIQTLFTLALTYLLSALNVAFRDLQHIVATLVMLAFFLTPVLWPMTPDKAWIEYANPMAAIVLAYRSIFLDHALPPLRPLAAVGLFSLALLWLSALIFEHRREEFAELA